MSIACGRAYCILGQALLLGVVGHTVCRNEMSCRCICACFDALCYCSICACFATAVFVRALLLKYLCVLCYCSICACFDAL